MTPAPRDMARALRHHPPMTELATTIEGPNGRLAARRIAGEEPGVFWLGGFASDMTGTKAAFLSDWAVRAGRAFVRFDYSGHGASQGRFEDGTIGAWTSDALAVFDALAEGPQILVGSSMGAWIATLLALARPEQLKGCVFIAPAPDFTEELIWKQLGEEKKERLMRDGRLVERTSDGGTSVITRRLVEEGRGRLVLGRPIPVSCPVRILHGMNDEEVPFRHAVRFAEQLVSGDLELTLVKAGDHRLSTPADLERLRLAIASLSRC
ncbi:MAG: alpha/beta hydrolase [Parvularculaceae bacterium]|nr:alpha/beta hydrolase [Parvularculaceae bacterium]